MLHDCRSGSAVLAPPRAGPAAGVPLGTGAARADLNRLETVP